MNNPFAVPSHLKLKQETLMTVAQNLPTYPFGVGGVCFLLHRVMSRRPALAVPPTEGSSTGVPARGPAVSAVLAVPFTTSSNLQISSASGLGCRPLPEVGGIQRYRCGVNDILPRTARTLGRSLFATLALLVSFPVLAADPPAESRKKTAAVAPVDDKNLPEVVAKVNGVNIKKTDLQNAIETMKMELEMIGQAVPPDRKDAVWRDVLDKIIGSELLAQEAKAKKVSVTEGEVDGELTKFREKFPSETVFQNFLKEQGFTEQDIRDEIRKSYGVSKMIKNDIYAKIAVDEKAAREFYTKNPKEFEEPELLRASHVLVKVDKGADEKTRADARKEAEQVLADAKAGKDFGTLAREHSDDPGSKEKGGDLGEFARDMMVPAFEEAAFKLEKPGDLSGVVETVYGFHVIKLGEKKPARVVPFEDVKEDLVNFLTMKKKDESLRAYVDTLRKKAKVQIFI